MAEYFDIFPFEIPELKRLDKQKKIKMKNTRIDPISLYMEKKKVGLTDSEKLCKKGLRYSKHRRKSWKRTGNKGIDVLFQAL